MARLDSGRLGVRLFLLLLFAIVLVTIAAPLPAEGAQNGSPDFSLGEPHLFIGGHVGMNLPRANSDLFSMVQRELTLEKSDFQAPMFGGDLGITFRSQFAAVISFDYARTSKASESRNFVEDNGDPIRQTTHFSLMPITGTLRFYPLKLGETVGSYVWIPTRILPYVGAGGGIVRYNFNQAGDFVDFRTYDIFSAELESSGFVPTVHVSGGIDVSLTQLIFVNVEARYSWANADLSRDFAGFEPIDLAGLRLVGGIYFRF